MAARDSLNSTQFDRYGGGYYSKPSSAESAVPSNPRYSGLANAATRASQDANEKVLTKTGRRSVNAMIESLAVSKTRRRSA